MTLMQHVVKTEANLRTLGAEWIDHYNAALDRYAAIAHLRDDVVRDTAREYGRTQYVVRNVQIPTGLTDRELVDLVSGGVAPLGGSVRRHAGGLSADVTVHTD